MAVLPLIKVSLVTLTLISWSMKDSVTGNHGMIDYLKITEIHE